MNFAIPGIDLVPDEGFKYPFFRVSLMETTTHVQKAAYLKPHRKNFFHLVYVKNGSGRHWVDMIPFDLKQDTFYFTTPEQVHLKEEASITGIGISFTREFFMIEGNAGLAKIPVLLNLQNGHELLLNDKEKRELEDILQKVSFEYRRPPNLQDDMVFAYMRVLFIFINRLYDAQFDKTQPLQSREIYRRFQRCVEEQYREIHEVKAYAGLLNISVGFLNTMVREQSGKTPLELVHDRLILEAKRILFHTERSVKEISFELGFTDDSYFNRFFKRMTGTTAASFRNRQ